MTIKCEGSLQRAGFDYGTEAWYCEECLREFHRREIRPDCTVPVHSRELAAHLRRVG